MLKSMTAFGRANIATPNGSFIIEIHSVNRKTLDVAINVPREILFADIEIRKWLTETVKRGRVLVRVTRDAKAQNLESALPDLNMLKKLKQKWEEYAKELGLDQPISLQFLTEQMQRLSLDEGVLEEASFLAEFKKGFDQALSELGKMKDTEGKALGEDIKLRLKLIAKALIEIEKLAPDASKKYREKILVKIKELSALTQDDEDKVARETMIYAEKVDITEEVTRLKSHISQFEEYCSSTEKRIGRTLDFLIQEMNREVNTIGSKSQEIEISKNVLNIKSELEKIREQVQNIE